MYSLPNASMTNLRRSTRAAANNVPGAAGQAISNKMPAVMKSAVNNPAMKQLPNAELIKAQSQQVNFNPKNTTARRLTNGVKTAVVAQCPRVSFILSIIAFGSEKQTHEHTMA